VVVVLPVKIAVHYCRFVLAEHVLLVAVVIAAQPPGTLAVMFHAFPALQSVEIVDVKHLVIATTWVVAVHMVDNQQFFWVGLGDNQPHFYEYILTKMNAYRFHKQIRYPPFRYITALVITIFFFRSYLLINLTISAL